MESCCLRLRLAFKNSGDILSDTQRSQGLKKSWILLQQQLQTIDDLSAYIIQTFHLHQSCPHGLLLSIDGFVLPPFQPICILKDQDIIRVKKKIDELSIKGSDAANKPKYMQIVEEPANSGALLLAHEEFEKESGGDQSEESADESEEDEDGSSEDIEHREGGIAISKKRKASEGLQGSKKKKQQKEPPRKKGQTEKIKNSDRGVPSRKKGASKKDKLSEHDNATPVKTIAERANKSEGNVESTPGLERNEEYQMDGKDVGDASPVSENAHKHPSRSARRKYAKRRWLREMKKIQKKGLDSSSKEIQNWKQTHAKAEEKVEVGQPKGLLHWKQIGQTDTSKTSGKNRRNDKKGIFCHNPILEDEVVPIRKRPGHICFEPLEEDQAMQQSQVSTETCQWNGTTSKKDTHPSIAMDFDKLPLIPHVPEEGDVIAYRVIELSSSWTPEFSSYRVGKVLRYNPKTHKIGLMSIQELTIDNEKSNEDESSSWKPHNSYKGDGLLEIDFRSLVHVRAIKYANRATTNAIPRLLGSGLSSTGMAMSPSSNNKQVNAPIPETGGDNHGKSVQSPSKESDVNVWEQFSEALIAKEELPKEIGWGKSTSGRSSWSFTCSRPNNSPHNIRKTR